MHGSTTPELAQAARRLAAMQKFRALAAIAALTILLATTTGCSLVGSSAGLADRTFLSVAVTDAGVARFLVPGTRIRLDFRAKELGASAGCNSMSGTWRIDGGRLVFDGGAMTEMGCDKDRKSQDDWLLALLGSKPTATLTGDELTLESGTTVVRLLDRKVVEPDVALTGHAWTVVSIMSGDTVSSVPGGASASVTFNADGTLALNAGCNEGGATWRAVGNGIEVSALGLTKKACQGARGQLESAVVGVLGAGSIAATIEADLLTLTVGGSGLQLRAS